MFGQQNAGQNHVIKVALKMLGKLRCLGKTQTHENCIVGEVKRRLHSENDYYHSVRNLLPSCLLYGKAKIELNKTIIMPVTLYGCETPSLPLVEEHTPRVSEKSVLRRIFGHKKEKVTGGWRNLHNEGLVHVANY